MTTPIPAPILDIAPLLEPSPSPTRLRELAQAIATACRDVGFFYIEGHGVLPADYDATLIETQRFFALTTAEKMKLHMGSSTQFRGYLPLGGEVTQGQRDWHECIDLQPSIDGVAPGAHVLDDPRQWPDALPTFREVMMKTWDQRRHLGKKLAEGLAISVGAQPRVFEPFQGDALCALRLSHYPLAGSADEPRNPVDAGMGAHCDLGLLTILQQDGVDGLEVRDVHDRWHIAPHVPGSYLVLIGEMMQRWTNDRYRATLHRVRLSQGRSRFAMPFFFEPRYDAVVEPLAACCDAEHPPRYTSFAFGEYLTARFSKAYD